MGSLAQDLTPTSEAYGFVQRLVSQADESRIAEVDDKAKDLTPEERQLLVDSLSMALTKINVCTKNADRTLFILTKVASSANIFARNRTLEPKHIVPEKEDGVYRVLGQRPTLVKALKRNKSPHEPYNESLISWAHLYHPSIYPLYAVFLEGEKDRLCLVSPCTTKGNICDMAKSLDQESRMRLIIDVINGLCYLHQLNIIHGVLTPQNVLISDKGRAVITNLDALLGVQDFEPRYSAPELFAEDDGRPSKEADMWSFACLSYEVLSGNLPFCQYRSDSKVATALIRGVKPIRPGTQDDVGGEKIKDIVWYPLSECWEVEPDERPICLELRRDLTGMQLQDAYPEPKPVVSGALEKMNAPSIKLELAKASLMKVLGSEGIDMPISVRAPEHLRDSLIGLVNNTAKVDAAVVAARKFSPIDTQVFLNFLDLVYEENPFPRNRYNPVGALLSKIMASTHIFPQRHKLSAVRYYSVPIVEGRFGNVHKGRDYKICVNVLTNVNDIMDLSFGLAFWAHSSHPNLLPFYGVFHECSPSGVPRICLVSPYMKNGNLHNYALTIPQKARIPLISDVINGLGYIHKLGFSHDFIQGVNVLISDEGRGLLTVHFSMQEIVTAATNASEIHSSNSYSLRFRAPERVKGGPSKMLYESDIWSFGCLCYEVLSRKLPYHELTKRSDVRSAILREEPLKRPDPRIDDIDEIDDRLWELIMNCCKSNPEDRLPIPKVREMLAQMQIQDDRPPGRVIPGPEILNLRLRADLDWDHVERLLDRIQADLLQTPLSKIAHHHVKDVATEVAKLGNYHDIQTMVNFLDLALKYYLSISDERNRVLAMLSRITTTTYVFPGRHEVRGIKIGEKPIAEGGFGRVYRGASNPAICIKVMTQSEPHTYAQWIRELIVWSHSSHPNVLPFYGMYLDEVNRICLVSPFMKNGNLHEYAPHLPQKDRMPLISDVIKGLDYLHGISIVHSDLKGQNVLISDEGRALITDFGASHVTTSTALGQATDSPVSKSLCFAAPEMITNADARPTKECDIWSFGCLCYAVLSRKSPYYECTRDYQITAALARGDPPKRPGKVNHDSEENDLWDDAEDKDWDDIDDSAWNLITKCCKPKPEDRLTAAGIQELIANMKIWDGRPEAKGVPGAEIFKMRSTPDLDLKRVGELLEQIQVALLVPRTRSVIFRDSPQDIAAIVTKIEDTEKTTALVDFLDRVLKDHLFEEREYVLNLLSSVSGSTRVLPGRYKLEGVQYQPEPISREHGIGTVHRGLNTNLCIKVLPRARSGVDLSSCYKYWLKMIAAWPYFFHPNILPLYGLYSEINYEPGYNCIVLPYLQNGNASKYTFPLPQQHRLPILRDIIEGLDYLHGLGFVHSNLKPENVLISDEGRALITDFGGSPVIEGESASTALTRTLRYTAPELVKNRHAQTTRESDIWSFGCMCYELLSRKAPYYQYTKITDYQSGLARREMPRRPRSPNDGTDMLNDQCWVLVANCCKIAPDGRPTCSEVLELLKGIKIQDNRPEAKALPGAEVLKLRPKPAIDIDLVEEALEDIQTRLSLAIWQEEDEEVSQN